MAYGPEVAAIYDLYFPPDRSAEADLWERLAPPGTTHLLELMVGTAEVALLLAQRGYDVTGVDLSAPMLAVAEERRQAAGQARLTLIHGDVCTADLPEARFGLAYVGNGSWNLLTERASRVQALASVRRSLAPGGRLALNLFPPLTRTGRSEPRAFRPLRPAPPGVEVVKTTRSERDVQTQLMRIHETLTVNGREWEHHLLLQALRPEEAVAELLEAGYAGVQVYGSDQLEPYADGADPLLIVAGAP